MTTCKQVYRHICESLDEGMDSARCRAIKRHLSSCDNCRAYLQSLKQTIRLYRASPHVPLPRSAHRRLWTALALEAASDRGHGTQNLRPRALKGRART